MKKGIALVLYYLLICIILSPGVPGVYEFYKEKINNAAIEVYNIVTDPLHVPDRVNSVCMKTFVYYMNNTMVRESAKRIFSFYNKTIQDYRISKLFIFE